MTDEWSVLSWKQKKAVRLAIKRDELIGMTFLKGIYSDKDRRRQAIRTMKEQNIIVKTKIGNKFAVDTNNIPDRIVEECKS